MHIRILVNGCAALRHLEPSPFLARRAGPKRRERGGFWGSERPRRRGIPVTNPGRPVLCTFAIIFVLHVACNRRYQAVYSA
jgi:hypothetical protein